MMAAKKEVMDPNEDRLSSHLEGMWTDHVSAAERDLKGSRLRDVMKARARTIHNTLKGAMDDVERQFCDGMRPLVKARLAKLPPSTPRPLDDVQISALCTATVKAFRVGFDRPWEIATLEKHLAGSMEPDPAADAPSRVLRAASDISTDPVGYLLGLVLGSAELPIAVETRDWLASTVAAYLDPFIDGEVPSSEYHSRSSGFFMERLQRAWQETHGDDSPMPIPVQSALAQYATHCITKMNTNFGFGPHSPGIGRQPTTDGETNRYFDTLGKALVTAIQREFAEPDRAFGSLPCLTAGHIIHVGKIHLNGLVMYQNELANALANANRDGEEARREERLRIWGYA